MLRNVKLTSDTPARSLSKLHHINAWFMPHSRRQKMNRHRRNKLLVHWRYPLHRSISIAIYTSINLISNTVVEGEFNLIIIIASTEETNNTEKELKSERHKFLCNNCIEKAKENPLPLYKKVRQNKVSSIFGVCNFTVSLMIYENCAKKYANVDSKVKFQNILEFSFTVFSIIYKNPSPYIKK